MSFAVGCCWFTPEPAVGRFCSSEIDVGRGHAVALANERKTRRSHCRWCRLWPYEAFHSFLRYSCHSPWKSPNPGTAGPKTMRDTWSWPWTGPTAWGRAAPADLHIRGDNNKSCCKPLRLWGCLLYDENYYTLLFENWTARVHLQPFGMSGILCEFLKMTNGIYIQWNIVHP